MSLRLDDVSHSYGKDPAVLSHVSLTFPTGNLVALVGPSGSGKTTLLAILGLLLTPTAGRIEVSGTEVGTRELRRPDVLPRTAWVFQTSNLLPRRTSLENAMLGPLSKGEDFEVAVKKASTALELLEMEQFSSTPVRLLSGGQTQRVGIARALAASSEFLFADEPTGQLDAQTTQLVMSTLAARRVPEKTTIIATHDMYVAAECDVVLRVSSSSVERLT